MIIVNLSSKKETKSDNPPHLVKYLLYGSTYQVERELSRVKFKGTVNCNSASIEDAGDMIKLLNTNYNNNASARSKDKLRTMHYEISLRAGEHLDEKQWQGIVKAHLKKLSLDEHLALFAVHKDTDNEHCHIVVSTVNPITFKINRLNHERRKLMTLAHDLEKKFNLENDNHGLENENTQEKGHNQAQNIESVTSQQTLFSYVKDIKPLLDNAQDWKEFFNICKAHNLNVTKMGRGIIFETDDPENKGKKLYVKASAFNKRNSPKLTLDYLERKFGDFPNSKDFDLSKIEIQKRYEASPINFLLNEDVKELDMNEMFDNYKRQKAYNFEVQSKKFEKLFNDYKKEQNQLKKSFLAKLKKSSNSEQKDILTKEYKAKRALNYEKYKADKKELGDTTTDTTNFLIYLKNNFNNKPIYKEARLLLLARTQSKSQRALNYAEIVKRRRNPDYSEGMTATYMNLLKCSNKGLEFYTSKNPAFSDWIKDDGHKIMICDHPLTTTVSDFLKLCKQKSENNCQINIFGNERFLQTAMEIAIQRNIFLHFEDLGLQNQFEERANERKQHQSERDAIREFSRSRTLRRNQSYAKRTTRGRVLYGKYGKYFRRYQVIGADYQSETDTNSSERDYISNDSNYIESLSAKRKGKETSNRNESSMSNLSELPMAREQQGSEMLLPANERSGLDFDQERNLLQGVRWQIHSSRNEGIESDTNRQDDSNKSNELNNAFDRISNSLTNNSKSKDEEETSFNNYKDEYLFNNEDVENYINERNEKHKKGFKDVKIHDLWTNEQGDFVYIGKRNLNNKVFALLEQNEIVFLKDVSTNEYTQKRLNTTKNGEIVKIDKNGTIINNNRNKNGKNKKGSK